MLGQDAARLPSRLSGAGSPLHAASLSSSPQGGIRLPSNFVARGFPDLAGLPFTPPIAQPAKFTKTNHALPYDAPPPPPHMPQRHFSRLADFDFSRPAHSDKLVQAGSRGYYCGFDTWQAPKGTSSMGTSSVVLVGFEGGLEVHRVNRHKREMVGRLEGLRGSVIEAKILPWTAREDPLDHLRPLVACVIHGPVVGSNENPEQPISASNIKEYHTFVEIYSMQTWQSVARLFQTQPERIHQPITSQGFTPPTPIGSLSVAAEGRFVLVTSGVSGEIYVFATRSSRPAAEQSPFCCLGKYWSSLKTRTSSSEHRHMNMPVETGSTGLKNARRPVYALSNRWLAIKPPIMSSSQMTLKGSTELASHANPASMASHASPAPPSPNCDIDAPFNDSLLSRVAKTTTREIYKGAQQGFQALKMYMNRPASTNVDPAYYGSPQSPQPEQGGFPPTHAHSNEPQTSPVEPALVSVIDLERLLEREESETKGASAIPPTFHLNDGCSFLSFSPNGLSLLATNHVGDESRIWDLTRIADSRAAVGDPSLIGIVRMVSRFHRVSPSVVMDAVWTACGDRLALITDKGTVHLYGLQSLEYKPLVTMKPPVPSPGSSPREEPQSSGIMGNVRAGWQSFHDLATRSRPSSSSITNTLGHAGIVARTAGTRAVRVGISTAAKGAHHIRHAEDNKIRLRPSHHSVAPGCVQWQHGKDKDIIATLCDGKLELLAVKNVSYTQARKTVVSPSVIKTPIFQAEVSQISSDVVPPAVLGLLEPQGPHGSCAREGVHGFCIWNTNPAQMLAGRRASTVSLGKRLATMPVQDKDTNPGYMPFHRLPHVNLFTPTPANDETDEPDDKFVFGLALRPAIRINCQQADDAEAGHDGNVEGEMEGLIGQMDETLRAEEFSNSHAGQEEGRLVDM